jgi:hypothetical protein
MDISIEARTARATALAKLLAGGTLCVRTGGKPADCAGEAAGSEITSLSLPNQMTVKDGGIVAVSAPLRGLAVAKGVPGHWRVEKGGKCVAQGNVGKDFPMPAQEIEQGQVIELRSWLITENLEN